MSYLLDTNAISEIRREDRAHPSVRKWFATQPVENLFLSAITILEIEFGILAKEAQDPTQGRVLRSWVTDIVLPQFSGRILPVDTLVATECARLLRLRTIQLADALIAATAAIHDFTLVTRNIAHLGDLGVPLLNPWED